MTHTQKKNLQQRVTKDYYQYTRIQRLLNSQTPQKMDRCSVKSKALILPNFENTILKMIY